MRIKVYVAGPISKGDLRENLQRAKDAGMALLKAGFAPLVPHFTCYYEDDEPRMRPGGVPHETWIDSDLPWVAAADAVLRLPGESLGADQEVMLANDLGIPVYHAVEDLIGNPPVRGDARFHECLRRMAALHDKKQADYGTGSDPFANVRASSEWGIAPWLGALVRLNDKVSRLKTFARTGKLANEGVEDSMLDIAVYAVIALVLFREREQLIAEMGDPH